MKNKLTFHYLLSFILACSVIFIVNIFYMRSNIYKEGALYNFYPQKMVASFKEYIDIGPNNKVKISNDGIKLLEKENIGMQILDENNKEIFSFNKPDIAKEYYSNISLIEMYENSEKTLLLEEENLNNKVYTYLLFLDSKNVKRINYVYDVNLVKKAHKFPILIFINIVLIFTMSLLFTSRITKPINRIIDKIISLSNGYYFNNDIKYGIYYEIENCLNKLGNRLEYNQNERIHLEAMREEWISNITHDIKTPLTSIIGNAEIMSDTEYELEDQVRIKYCNTILSKSEYIKTLVEDLNLSTRLKSNNLVLNKSNINIVSLIRHLLIDIINDEKYSCNNIKFTYSQEDIFVNVDEQLMKSVFINLIINAFVHNEDNVNVKIHIQKLTNNNVKISVEDDGKGVSKKELEHIFKRFYRGTDTRKKVEGSGLGMAIAHDIVMAHSGKISVSSKIKRGLKIDISLS